MSKTVLHPGYFGSIDQFYAFYKADQILWENADNYQKQTYRNRQYIYGANGKLLLNIPIVHAHKKEGRQLYKDVKIENHFNWQNLHLKSLESAYRASPFFEFYEDDLAPLYNTKFTYLIDFNIACWTAIQQALDLEKIPEKKTQEYLLSYANRTDIIDRRELIIAKRKSQIELTEYPQVFQEKHGFIPNLSILDLLFNEGPQTVSYFDNLQ